MIFSQEVIKLGLMERKKRVLVVDDEPGIVMMLRIKLSLSGFDVSATTKGAEAIELVRTYKPDIVVLDIQMPSVSGMDVLKQIRDFSQVPIIVFTGLPEIARYAAELGAKDYIPKPFNPDTLVQKIQSVLTSARGNIEPTNPKKQSPPAD